MPLVQLQKQPIIQLPKKLPEAAGMPNIPSADAQFPDSDNRTFLMQPWMTIRGSTSPNVITTITQDDALWFDLSRFADAGFWVDVSGVTTLGGTAPAVFLNLESSPTKDEQDFRLVAPPLKLTPIAGGGGTVAPLFTKTVRSPTTVPLSRYTRWRLTAEGTTGTTWDVSFRIRGVGGYSRFWVPTDIVGCQVWLRADLGIAINSANARVSNWADQSGNAHDASQGTTLNQPAYSATAMNGFPALLGDGTNYFMTTSSFNFLSNATFIAAVRPASTSQTNGSRLIESRYDTSYYLATDIPPVGPSQHYKWVVNNPTPPYGVAEGSGAAGAIAVTNQIVSATYDSTSAKGRLYLNGGFVAEDTFTAPLTVNAPLFIMRAFSYAGSYWNGYLAEALVYDHALAPNEFSAVHRYLGTRYGVVIA